MDNDDENMIISGVNVITRDSTAIHSSRVKINFDSSKGEENGDKYIREFHRFTQGEHADVINGDNFDGINLINKDETTEDNSNSYAKDDIVEDNSNSKHYIIEDNSNSKHYIIEDNSNSSANDYTVEEETVLRNYHRNSYDNAAIESRIKELEESFDCLDSEEEINDVVEPNLIEVEMKLKSFRRSESTENLLSNIITTNIAKPNDLMNIKMLLNHESHHLCLLTTIQQYKYILQQSKVHDDVVWNIFYNISDLIYAQNSLVTYLETMLADFDSKLCHFDEIMDLYTLLHVKCKEYVKNIPTANRELKNLFEKHSNFKSAIHEVTYEGKTMHLDVLIAKPINWLCNSLELIKNLIDTADGEQDVRKLEETLKNLKSDQNEERKSNKNTLESNNLLRSSLFVELLSADVRKLRHVFLFSGMIVCAKQKLQSECNHSTKPSHADHEEKVSASKGLLETKFVERFDAKWFISLKNLVFHLSKTLESNDRRKNDIAVLKDKIRELKLQLTTEKSKLNSDIDAPNPIKRSISNISKKAKSKKDVDRLCNSIFKIQTELLLISPTVEFLISNGPERSHTLLLPSVKDLEIWKCEILKVQREQKLIDCSYLSLAGVNNLLENFRRNKIVIDVATCPLLHDDGISGVLSTNIYKVEGLNPDFRYYLSIEVDSFNLNELKARTKLCTGLSSLVWQESFDIDLDCSQTMNILVYEIKNYGEYRESLIGYFDFQLKSMGFHNQKVTKTVSLLSNESAKLTLEVSFKYEAKNELLKRQPSIMITGLFGKDIKSIISRERKGVVKVDNVPMILVECLKRIEENGLDEEGIYRISGSKNEINEFYRKLNKNPANALKNINTYDLHTVTGIVKMYLRELPEPLMKSSNYEHLLRIAKIEDEASRFQNYEEVINKLPEPNHSTLIFLLKHFEKVISHSQKNQMVAGNLGLILGPTLILPPCNLDKHGVFSGNIAVETMQSFLLARAFTQILLGLCKRSIRFDPSYTDF